MMPGTAQSRPLILWVEDEEDLRRDIADELSEAGYEVIEAGDGAAALQQLGKRRPDLILCDISMPGLNGHAVLRAIQDNGGTYDEIPFVFLSALADPREVVAGKRLGADDYLVKPIDYDLLLATIDARLRQVARLRAQLGPRPSLCPDMLAREFGLTPAEARVALALLDGKQPAQIAAELAIARTTVVFHLRNIFQKTNTSRQAEFVALILR